MKKTDRNFFFIMALVLAPLADPGLRAERTCCAIHRLRRPGQQRPGRGGGVSVSDGVILLTLASRCPPWISSRWPYPRPTSANPAPNPDEEDLPTPGPTLDIKSLQLPKGMSIYPGATDVQASAVGRHGVKSLRLP